jgi:D-tyrosyl-tRNA(Tyr) deacylase
VGHSWPCSQFTLLGDVRRGHRPSFTLAMEPERAHQLFEPSVPEFDHEASLVATGRFRASMQVSLVNDGPVTILIDTEKAF